MFSVGHNSGAAMGQRKRGQRTVSATQFQATGTSQVTIGSSLPRTARVRLGLMQAGSRKKVGSKLNAANVGKELPRLGGSGSWAVRHPPEFSDIAPVLYSDGILPQVYSSLSENRAPSSSPGTDKSMTSSAGRMDTRGKRWLKEKSATAPRPWNAKVDARGKNFIQQATPKAFCHNRPSRVRQMLSQEMKSMSRS